ncbi:IS4 family transposase [Rhodopseudomonas sp. BR0M22]|nr:IS4 family transposase [Rhodopseudomonas sp. BR0M22]
MLARLVDVGRTGISVRRVGGDRAGEIRFTRFLRNPRVTPQEMVAHARARTAGLVEGRHILAIQDTTTLRDDGKLRSLNLHPTIAVDAADGGLLGLVDAVFLSRSGGTKRLCAKRPFADKESRRWLDATRAAAGLVTAGAACVTVIADREGDIYDEFACRPAETELLIRAHHDRALEGGGRLYDCMAQVTELGRETIDLPANPGRAARRVTLALRAREVTLKRPKRNHPAEAAHLPKSVTLTLMEAREINPPPSVAPVHWRLLTTHEVTTLAQALLITEFYRQRWTIEQVFRLMKTKGFDIEAVRIAEGGPFENLTTATLIAAIQVLQMVRERDGAAGRPIQDTFDPDDEPALQAICRTLEGSTAKQKNPHPPGSLAYASWICARLGGWTGYYGKPGPIVILHGLQSLRAMLAGWKLRPDV